MQAPRIKMHDAEAGDPALTKWQLTCALCRPEMLIITAFLLSTFGMLEPFYREGISVFVQLVCGGGGMHWVKWHMVHTCVHKYLLAFLLVSFFSLIGAKVISVNVIDVSS